VDLARHTAQLKAVTLAAIDVTGVQATVELPRVEELAQSRHLSGGATDVHPGDDFHDTYSTGHFREANWPFDRFANTLTVVAKCFPYPYLHMIEGIPHRADQAERDGR